MLVTIDTDDMAELRRLMTLLIYRQSLIAAWNPETNPDGPTGDPRQRRISKMAIALKAELEDREQRPHLRRDSRAKPPGSP